MIKLIVSDMDGTLLNEEVRVSKANISAIKRAQNEGIHFAIATGRDYDMAQPFLEEHSIACPLIVSNGAQFFDENGQNKYNFGLEKSTVRKMMAFFEEYPSLHVELVTNKGLYSDNKDERKEMFAQMLTDINPDLSLEDARKRADEQNYQTKINFVDNFDAVLSDNEVVILKVTVHTLETPEILPDVREDLNKTISDLAITASSNRNLEINHSRAQKGIAVAKYAKSLGIKSDEVMTLGDNLNDVSMLEWAKYSTAMENAAPKAKEAANYQTSSNRHNGVAEAISRVLRNEYDEN